MIESQTLISELTEALGALKRIMMHSRDRLMGELQLTRTQIEVLFLLGDNANQTVGELASQLGVTNSAATQTIETLVKRSLIERTEDPTDRRIVRTNLSLSGQSLADRLHSGRIERMNQVFADLSVDEIKLMIAVVHRLSHQFDDNNAVQETK